MTFILMESLHQSYSSAAHRCSCWFLPLGLGACEASASISRVWSSLSLTLFLGMKFGSVLLLQLTAVASVKVQHIFLALCATKLPDLNGTAGAEPLRLSSAPLWDDLMCFSPALAEETCTPGDVLSSAAGRRDVCVTSWELPSVCEESTLASSPYARQADGDKCWQFQITDASIKFALLHQQASLCSASRQRRQSQLEKCMFWR